MLCLIPASPGGICHQCFLSFVENWILCFYSFQYYTVQYWGKWRERERERERERGGGVVASTQQNADSRPSELEIKEGQPPHLPSQPHLWHLLLPSLWLMACRISEDASRRQSKMDPLFRRNCLLATLNLMGLWANKVVPPQSSQSWHWHQ